MTRRNRVTAFGELVAEPWRGLLTGNRGCLHDEGETILRTWKHRAWISCQLSFRGRHRPLMPPRRWTALFFQDEATALAAGHRPCGECRREAYRTFMQCWRAAGLHGDGPRAVDATLHAARLDGRRQRRHEAPVADLPDGAMIALGHRAARVEAGAARPVEAGGYGAPLALSGRATVLTPEPVVAVLRQGYRPLLRDDG